MGVVVAGAGEGGGRRPEAGAVICFRGTGGPPVWVRDAGYIPTHWEETERLPLLVRTQVEGEAAKKEDRWDICLTPNDKGDGRGGHTGGG